MNRTRPILVPVSALALSLAAPAQLAGHGWTSLADGEPAARAGHALATHEASGRVILSHGYNQVGYYDETWGFDGQEWSLVPTEASPAARGEHGLVYDARREVLVLFGGQVSFYSGGTGYSPSYWYGFDDTWEWDGEQWAEVHVTGPAARGGHAMSYDAHRGVVVLHGGFDGAGYRDDTWEYDGAAWTLVAPTGPGARAHHAAAYDPRRRRTVLFGGAGPALLAPDTWEWDGRAWTLVSTTGPAARLGHDLTFDPGLGAVLLFGGQTADGDTWYWKWGRWHVAARRGPEPRWVHQMTYSRAAGGVILYGGYSTLGGVWRSDTWAFGATARER